MNDVPRDKYEILDVIFTVFHSFCMILTAFFLLSNLIVSLIFSAVIVVFTFLIFYFWKARNPFNIYLVRAFAFNNFFLTFVGLLIFFSVLHHLTSEPTGYIILLLPSVVYLAISYKFSAISVRRDKRVGIMLAYAGKSRAARRQFFGDNPEERIRREELIAKQKKEYNYKLIIVLTIILTLSSFTALIFGFS